MRIISLIITSLLTPLSITSTYATKVKDPYASLECPKLSLGQAIEIIKSGKMIGSIPHYVAFAQSVHSASDLSHATSLNTYPPFEDVDGNVFCKYELSDSNKHVLYELSLRPNYGVTEEPAER